MRRLPRLRSPNKKLFSINMTTGIVWDPRYLDHNPGTWHPESPARLRAIRAQLDRFSRRDKLVTIESRFATAAEVALVHQPFYIDAINAVRGKESDLDPDTHTSAGSVDAAYLAVGGLLASVDAVAEKKVENAFAFVRPPGHHAEENKAMGFCLFNNIAIAAEYALKCYGYRRIFIMDFDVHHGNGTQHHFDKRADVFYCSTHRYPFYPGTGAASEEGSGPGKGYTRNIPMRAGMGDLDYDSVFEKIVLPIARDYNPELVLISAGYDAHARDPLGGMAVTKDGFRRMTEGLVRIARDCAGGRLVAVLEGGYDLTGLAESVEASLEAMLASRSPKAV